jgi:phosphopantothenoylcysteine decarboxylase/phosphopantothenate--cysteine ligase
VSADLRGRRIVLGVTGGIAAYKAIEVCRRLVDAGAHVAPVLTRSATRFVGELTFSALASEPARVSLWGNDEPIPHTRLGQMADLVVVVPATARLIGAYAAGISSDLLTATLLATRAPVLLAPAMHTEMWEHPAVVDNVATLRRRGVQFAGPEAGHLAGGDTGYGRLADPEVIVAAAAAVLAGVALRPSETPRPGETGVVAADIHPVDAKAGAVGPAATGSASGLRALVTAGGTREPIDAVRFIGNRSSGRQGHAIAAELVGRGATVTLVTASDLPAAADVTVERVDTAAEMHDAVRRLASTSDLVVMTAAVADFRPKVVAEGKLKKADGIPELILEQTPDILAELGATRRPGQVLVGFAAEAVSHGGATDIEALRTFAETKLRAKRVDVIVANDVAAPGVGFAHPTNAVLIVTADGTATAIPLAGKAEIASAVVDSALAYGVRRRTPHPEEQK